VLSRCIDSIRASDTPPGGGIEILVVTSGCTHAERESLESRSCIVIELPQPVPTSQSRNIGAEQATGKVILFLDDDNVVAKDAISILANRLQSWRDSVLLGPAMFYGAAPNRLWCAGVRRSRILMKTSFRRAFPEPLPDRMPSDDFPNCFMVQRDDFAAVRGFDSERFPQQWEEGDLARRLVGATGRSVFVVPEARVWHFIDLPLVRRLHLRDERRAFLVARGRAMFTAVHGDRVQWVAYLLAAQWMFGAFYLAAAFTLPRRQWANVFAGYIRGMIDGLREGRRARLEDRTKARIPLARA
jgi:GT2 family glycosyltransferase